MRKLFVFILCAMLIFALPVVAYAEDGESASEEIVTEVEDTVSMTDTIVEYVKTHVEEIFVILAMALGSFYEARVRGKMTGSIGLLNNNAITIAERSAEANNTSLAELKNVREEFVALLAEVRKNVEEKESLEETLNQAMQLLKTAKMAMLELSNEVAELLVLANIPNSVKDNLTARHLKAVRELEAAEVMNGDGKEA